MKNTISDLSNYLFAQLERLDNEELTKEELELEIERGKAINAVAQNIIGVATTAIRAEELKAEYSRSYNAENMPRLLESK